MHADTAGSGVTHDARLAGLFDVLANSEALIIADTDWPDDAAHGREWWRLVTTMLVARTMKRPVLVSNQAVPESTTGRRDAIVDWLIGRIGTPIDGASSPIGPPIPLGPVAVGTEVLGEHVIDGNRDQLLRSGNPGRGRPRSAPFPHHRAK